MDIAAYLLDCKGICLSAQQRAAVEAPVGTVLLLAVPGAGKTTVLAARIARLLTQEGEVPEGILTLTFGRESVRDLRRRWEALFGELIPRPPAFSTIHSLCCRLLRERAAEEGTRLPELLEEDWEGQRVFGDFYRRETGLPLTGDAFRRMRNAMGYCVNMELSPREARALDSQLPGFSRLREEYAAWKRENHRMDFDDMLLSAHALLREDPGFAARVRGRYRHILVDEAQDLSRLQHSIIRQIAGDSLFMVGDEDQSIYGFRGADPQGMARFWLGGSSIPPAAPDVSRPSGAGIVPSDTEIPAARAVPGPCLVVEDNYRSTGAIVAGANRLIAGNRCRFPKAIRASRETGKPIRVIRDLDLEEEYQAAARLLERLPAGESCAVLYRAGFSGIGLGWVLRRRGIPFSCRGTGLSYSADPVTREVEGFFRLAENPGDARAFRRVCFRLGEPIPLETVGRALAAEPKDILKYLRDQTDYPRKNPGRLDWVRRVLRGMRGKPPLRQLDSIMDGLGYPWSAAGKEKGGEAFLCQRLAVLRVLAAQSPDTAAFLKRLREAEEVLDSPGGHPILLSTVHSAKGREFDRVIILDALEGIFPACDAIQHGALGWDQRMEEETRLFYTAMTRARDRLVILAPSRFRGRPLPPSRFLSAAGAEDGKRW